ncbi:MAG: hypothetical protein AVDCRST_MAG77-1252 [uncultured Chloroflexi bacterium]|uniref:DUF2089 domain-containing protein n=1 Tax=uncultured Chloroflexota bacterium TaxID=166587 RepID=A0A6J4HWI2_9CHLR|nr:MAG: hypothetical protein AVDCRST_MAG77-1252 [uncultured Chloroflexota bacterium]
MSGSFQPAAGRLVNLPEPHASLLELFLRVRGNVKDVERELGLSYPTVRARLEEAFAAARPKLAQGAEAGAHSAVAAPPPPTAPQPFAAARALILDALERGEITAAEATTRLRALKRS